MNHDSATTAGDDATTSGSASRPPRDLGSPRVLDLAAEASTLFDEPEWGERDRNSRTIVASDGLRITLTALRSGAEIGSEGSDDTIAVQVLRGRVGAQLDAEAADIAAGQLAAMAQPGPWRLTATEDALLLLTVAIGAPSGGR